MTYTPHGEYSEELKGFNTFKYFPELFKDIDFRDFCVSLRDDFGKFVNSSLFIMTSKEQENHQARLLMLISAIENVYSAWKPLENVLKSGNFKRNFIGKKDLSEAYTYLLGEIENYNNEFGSFMRVYRFFQENATRKEKEEIVNGVQLRYLYKASRRGKFTVFTPESVETVDASSLTDEELDIELRDKIKRVVYKMRNAFVHKATYFPFPNDISTSENGLPPYMTTNSSERMEDWVITISFDRLHSITKRCFQGYWVRYYRDNMSRSA